ncbi:MAG: twin-arginine translocation signal domain-containing protein, partial [Armatimonadetes bacterium]|nr:twin-arginine translocation signal domain-containing protein [Armatimonadota bacterium]
MNTRSSTRTHISRRDFLKETGAAIAGLTLMPNTLYARGGELSTDKKIRIGVVGGNFGCSFQWHEHPNCVVEAVSDLRPERLQNLKNVYKCSKGYE